MFNLTLRVPRTDCTGYTILFKDLNRKPQWMKGLRRLYRVFIFFIRGMYEVGPLFKV